MIHPKDDTGDVLRRMEAKGDDLTQPRDIDFTVVFKKQENAEKFAEHFRGQGYVVTVENAGTVVDFPWDVVVVKNMTPSHRDITNFEANLKKQADSLGGYNDGWGCITQNR